MASDSYHKQRAIEKIHNMELAAVEEEVKREVEGEQTSQARSTVLTVALVVALLVLGLSYFRNRAQVFVENQNRSLTLIEARSDGKTTVRVVVGVAGSADKSFRDMNYKGVKGKLTVFPGEKKFKGAALPGYLAGQGLHFVLDFQHVEVPVGDCDIAVQIEAGAHDSQPLSVKFTEPL